MQLHPQYYYQQLPPPERAAYHGMLTCLRELAPSARIPRLTMETLSTLFFQLRLDHPEIFYAVGFSCRAVPEAEFVDFCPEYRFDKKRIREHRQAIEARAARLLRPLRSLPPTEQERAIHDFIVENVRYDKLEKPYSHEVIGPLTNGVGVCEGMAKTVKLLCDGLGLPCMIAVSDRDRANGDRYLHAWNIVQLDGQCYHLDATFDNSLSKHGVLRYDYFNLDDTKIFRDHRKLLYPAPACTDGGQFYYKLQHLSWTKPEEVVRRVDQALRKKQPGLVFHWRGGYLTREVLTDLCTQIDAAAYARARAAAISVNWPQAVCGGGAAGGDGDTRRYLRFVRSVQNDGADRQFCSACAWEGKSVFAFLTWTRAAPTMGAISVFAGRNSNEKNVCLLSTAGANCSAVSHTVSHL